ncbi:MAG: radical SAM protein [Sandaracinaceae bacterium]
MGSGSPGDARRRRTGRSGGRDRSSLILTITRECDLRCSYCPTVKEGWPSLDPAQIERAIALFCDRFGGGDVKLFGGEPLLFPALVDAALEAAQRDPRVHRIYLSTNGLGLDEARLERLAREPKLVLTVSMDGEPADHRRLRRPLNVVDGETTRDAYAHLRALMPTLRRMPRAVVTQTIAPATAARAARNFAHLRQLGWWRFNLLPGYYLPWRAEQLTDLREGFAEIGRDIRRAWAEGERLYVRNLFTLAPTPFFNVGMVVDSDGSIHASNVGLASSMSELLDVTRVGSLDDPPSREALSASAAELPRLLEETVPAPILESTRAVDAALSALVRDLYPAYLRARARRRASAVALGAPGGAA